MLCKDVLSPLMVLASLLLFFMRVSSILPADSASISNFSVLPVTALSPVFTLNTTN